MDPNGKVQQFLRMLQRGTKTLKKISSVPLLAKSGDDEVAVVHDEV
jgi:hypothetical protein